MFFNANLNQALFLLSRSGISKITINNRLIIVIFDIPERERRKRAWLRLALKNIGLKLIQRSVWMGKVKIPKEFLDDIRELHLVNFVEIFEITKSGSLNQVIQ